MDNPASPHSLPEARKAVSIERPGLYCVEVERKPSPFPVISAEVTGAGLQKTIRLVGHRHTPYLLSVRRGPLSFAFDPADVEGVRLRPSGVLDWLSGLERPRVLRRLSLPIGANGSIRPLLRRPGGGRELAKAMRLLTGWGFGITTRNFQDTPGLFSPIAPAAETAPTQKGQPRFAVVLHLFHSELWPEFSFFLRRIERPFHLIVTTSLADGNFQDPILRTFPGAEIVTMANRGRDIGPFLQLLHDGKLDRYRLICKLHGKRTGAAGYRALLGQVWRRANLLDLIGSEERVKSILARFESNPAIGMVGSSRFRLPSDFMPSTKAWGGNKPLTLDLAVRMGQISDDFQLDFFAGTMFWARPEALRPLKALRLTLDDFPEETGQRDGELHHAVERLLGAAPSLARLSLDEVEPIFL